MMSLRLLFQPEPLEQLRERLPAALAESIDIESVDLGVAEHPGRIRRHCFDFFDGLRLVVTRDCCPDGRRLLHVAATIFPGADGVCRLFSSRRIECEMRLLSEELADIPFRHVTGCGVFHWAKDERKES